MSLQLSIRLLGGLIVAVAAVSCNVVLGIESGEPAAPTSTGSGGSHAGGSTSSGGNNVGGNSGGSCPSFVGVPPGDCTSSDYHFDSENCCVEGRSCRGGTCANGKCSHFDITTSPYGDVIDVLFVGDRVLWSTGENHRIYSVSVSGGTPQLIAIDANYLPTMLATDGTFVYWVQNDGPEVRRALLDGGSGSGGASAGQLVSQVPNGTAGWGRLVVRDGLVFWVTSDYPAGVWLANADGTSLQQFLQQFPRLSPA